MPLTDGQQVLESGKPAAEQPGVTYKGTTNGDAVYEVGSRQLPLPGRGHRRHERQRRTSARTVPATLALTLGTASLGALTPGVAQRLHGATLAPPSPAPPATPR